MSMTTGFLLGAGLGGAVCLLLAALFPPRPALARSVARWERQRGRVAASTGSDAGYGARIGRWLVAALERRGINLGQTRADLTLLDQTLEQHLLRKVGFGLAGLLLPTLSAAALAVLGLRLPLATSLATSVVLGLIFFFVPDINVSSKAKERRQEMRRALSCYLDLVSMALGGGRGVPEALPTCARLGTGHAFELLEETISRARYTGMTPWEAIEDLGARTQLQELQELGGALSLVADDGAKVRESLAARASTLRRRRLAEAEEEAAKGSESMSASLFVLASSFVLLLGYPALTHGLSGL